MSPPTPIPVANYLPSGRVRVSRVASVAKCGRVTNRRTAEIQVRGGEVARVGATDAIVNAVFNATSVCIPNLPIRIEDLL